MAGDLPPGRWSALLVGAWWPARPDAPMAGVTYWRKAAQLKRNEANDLRNERSLLAVNQGRTADDLLERYWRGEQRLATIAHQCEVKSDQSEQVADAVNYLRDRLTEIAQSGNQQINQILAGKGPIEAKVAAVNAVIEQSNAMADHVGATAMSNIIDATQRVFDETIGGDAHTWLRDHGVSLDAPARPRPVTAEDMTSMTANSPAGSPFGAAPSAPSHSTTTSGPPTAPTPTSPFGTAPMVLSSSSTSSGPPTAPTPTSPFGTAPMVLSSSSTSSGPPTAPTPTSPFGTAPMVLSSSSTSSGPPTAPTPTSPFGTAPMVLSSSATTSGPPTAPTPTSPFGTAPMVLSSSSTSSGPPTAPTPTSPFGTAPMPPGPPPPGTVSPPLPPSAPAVGVGGPSVPAAGMPPAAAAATAPLSPQSLGQSFTTGMTTGTPAAAGAQALSAGVVHAATEPLPPPAPPPTTPTVTTPTVATATTAGIPHIPDSAPTPSPAPIAPPTTDNASAMTPIAPMVANGPPASPAPPAAAPAGPLPAYGADLRPPVTTPPATPPTPTGPISGAAVTPSSPAAGGSLMSPVVNKSTAPATTQAQPSNPTPPLASATAAATTGAAAGDTSRRAAEQQRLRRILDTVARQEPGLSWAAGLRDNGQTTLLVTDLASGWIPPHIRLPAHITLLEPAPRRRHATVTDLLGTTTVAAAHHPHGYLSQPDPDTPALTGDRTARIAPTIDELGPTLVETVRRHDTLPRIAQAVVVAATRNYGVPDNETDLLHHKTTEIHQAVLTTYPNHDIATVVDWMLLAAINALIAGDQSGANYHLAWAIAAISTRRSR
ncbi:DUF5631 domain-containing protein [Mycobacterium tuberculosis]|uniref:DUF5631 domain-containing protein n=1 Tax=Mycobacterium tuberculosis TaxID=1773 RepID=UPI0004F31C8E